MEEFNVLNVDLEKNSSNQYNTLGN